MPAVIDTMESRLGYSDLREHAARNRSSTGDQTLPGEEVLLEPTVEARVNQGRWIADCPDPYCGGAELVSFDNPVFFCCECRNRGVGYALIPVAVPVERVKIEECLTVRPDIAARSWEPGETVADLQAENDRLLKAVP